MKSPYIFLSTKEGCHRIKKLESLKQLIVHAGRTKKTPRDKARGVVLKIQFQ
jgi:hypothetical protein